MVATRKIFLLVLALAAVTMAVMADDSDESSAESQSGTCGDVTFTFDTASGTFTVSGSGTMADYSKSSPSGFEGYDIKTVVIESGVTHIGDYVFADCKSITSVTIAGSVTSIGSNAFKSCHGLTSVTIPGSVKTLGDYAFGGCTNLTQINFYAENCDDLTETSNVFYLAGTKSSGVAVTIGAAVINVPNYLFYGCTSITSVDISVPVNSLGRYAFCGCSGLTSVTIPNSVKTIKDSVFQNCTSLEFVSIPDSVHVIGAYAFFGCTSLKAVTLGKNVDSIASYAFGGCTALSSIAIPENVGILALSLFEGCTSLESITLPDSVTGIKNSAFKGCTSLKSVKISDSVDTLPESLFEGCTALTDVTLGSSVKTIAASVFKGCTSLISLSIPDKVTSIGESAFENCSGLASLTVPVSVTSIGKYAFKGCSTLAAVTFNGVPDGITAASLIFSNAGTSDEGITVTFGSSVTEIPDYLFYFSDSTDSANIVSVVIGDNVKTIGEFAFYNCTGLRSVKMGGSVESVGQSAFYGCSSLETIVIPDTVTSVGKSAFYNCTSLGSAVIGGKVQTIADFTFRGCKSLSSVTIGGSVTFIGNTAFYGCSSLGSLDVPDSVKKIDNGAFHNCTSLTSVKIGANVTSIGWHTFAGCTGLTVLTIPDSVKTIEMYAFFGCTALRTVKIGCSVETIGDYAFECTALTSVELPDSVKTLGWGVFRDCTFLASANIPKKVTSIGEYLFYNCTLLDQVYFDAVSCSDLNRTSDVFYNAGISGEGIDVVFGSAVQKIPAYLFYVRNTSHLPNLVSVTVGDSVTSIGDYAFGNCSSLGSVKMGDSVTTIGAYAFYGCSGLSEFTLTEKISSIGESAFEDCTALTSVTLPQSVTSIGNHAFKGCTLLTSLTINGLPDSITEGSEIFCKAGTSGTGIKVKFGGSVTEIPTYLFQVSDVDGLPKIFEVETGDTVTSIADSAFKNMYVFSVELGASVKTIGSSAFEDSSLAFVTLGGSLETIGNSAFKDCMALREVEIPGSVKYIGDYAFSTCAQISSITIPDSVTFLGEYVFQECSSLTSVTIGKSVTSIGDSAFYGCRKLESVTIPDSVKSIGELAFVICKSLTSLEIGDGVTSIGGNAFKGCTSLTTVKIGSSVEKIGDGAFDDTVFCDHDGSELEKTVENLAGFTFQTVNEKLTRQACTITFDSGVEKMTVPIGDTIDYPVPTRTGYDFLYWSTDGKTDDRPVTMPDGNISLIAVWSPIDCTVTFISDGKSVDTTQSYGDKVVLPDDPTKDPTVDTVYIFAGWKGYTEGMTVSGDMTFEAEFTENARLYRIVFLNDDGSVISEDHLGYGKTITAPTASKSSTAEYYYEFSKWVDPNGDTITVPSAVEADLTAKAVYVQHNQRYTVTYKVNGVQIGDPETAEYGSTVTVRGQYSEPGHTVSQWTADGITVSDGKFTMPASGVVFNATSTVNTYTVKFTVDGAEYHKESLEYGSVIVLPEEPTKESVSTVYTFKGWKGYTDGMTVSDDNAFEAEFSEKVRTYTVTFRNYDGSVVFSGTLGYGSVITAPANPSKPSDVQYDYIFAGWEGYTEGMTVSGEMTFTAAYTPQTRSYNVVFKDYDGSEIASSTTEYGTVITLPQNPARTSDQKYDYIFAGWDGYTDGMTVKGDVTFTAKYDGSLRSYTIEFKDFDGTELSSSTLKYGSSIELPEAPTRTSDAQYDYSFSKWDGYSEGMTVSGDAVFIAEYDSILRSYAVTFKDYDGSVVSSDTLAYGSVILTPADPSMESDVQYDYIFSGWNGYSAGQKVTGTVTFTATYTPEVRSYKVVFNDYDGSEISSSSVKYGSVITLPAQPVRDSDQKYDYTFAGWGGYTDGMTVNGNVTFTAKYDGSLRSYTVKFQNYDGSEVSSETLEYGKSIGLPDQPSRGSDERYNYTFSKWKGYTPGMTVSGDAVFTAEYDLTPRMYTIIFQNYDGSELSSVTLAYDTVITLPSDPSKPSDAQYDYKFSGWNGYSDGMKVTKNVIFVASYTPEVRSYKVIFNDFDGREISSSSMAYGSIIAPPEEPSRASDPKYDYTFSSWGGYMDGMTVKGDVTFTAAYTFSIRSYSVVFVDYDRTELSSDILEYGSVIEAPEGPVRAEDAQYTYGFSGWKGYTEGMTVSGDAVFVAEYSTTLRTYTVVFKDYDGSVISSEVLGYGSEINVPEDPSRPSDIEYDYTFAGWKGLEESMKVTGDVTFTAIYTEKIRSYTVVFRDCDGSMISTSVQEYGSLVILPEQPSWPSDAKYDYTFSGWSGYIDGMRVIGDLTFTAQYDCSVHPYSVVFLNHDGSVLSSSYAGFGDVIALPEQPVRDADAKYSYVFTGWNGYSEGMKVSGDVSFTAMYIAKSLAGSVYVIADRGHSVGVTLADLEVIERSVLEDDSTELMIIAGDTTVTFDSEALKALKMYYTELDIMSLSQDSLSDAMRATVGDNPVYSVSFGTYTTFGGGKVTVTLPYALSEGRDEEGLSVWCVKDDGTYEVIPCTYSDDSVTFVTHHFSVFATVYSEPSEDAVSVNIVLLAVEIIVLFAAVGAVVAFRRR